MRGDKKPHFNACGLDRKTKTLNDEWQQRKLFVHSLSWPEGSTFEGVVLRPHDVVGLLVAVAARERRPAAQQDVRDNANGPQVALLRIACGVRGEIPGGNTGWKSPDICLKQFRIPSTCHSAISAGHFSLFNTPVQQRQKRQMHRGTTSTGALSGGLVCPAGGTDSFGDLWGPKDP